MARDLTLDVSCTCTHRYLHLSRMQTRSTAAARSKIAKGRAEAPPYHIFKPAELDVLINVANDIAVKLIPLFRHGDDTVLFVGHSAGSVSCELKNPRLIAQYSIKLDIRRMAQPWLRPILQVSTSKHQRTIEYLVSDTGSLLPESKLGAGA